MSNIIKYRPDIDGLRAISIMSVFLFHLNQDWLKGGFLGVDIFFVISGYLITKIIIGELKNNSFSFTNFYSRRIKRIFPALLVMLFATGLTAVISLPSLYFRGFFTSFCYASAQLSNFLFAENADYFNSETIQILLHTWSLAVEEQFYLIWPLILFFLFKIRNFSDRKFFAVLIFIALVSFSLNLLGNRSDPQYAFYMFYTRSWQFCCGAIIALDIIKHSQKKPVNELVAIAGIILISCSFLFIDGDKNLGYLNLIPCIGATLILHAGKPAEGSVYKILSFKPLVFIGLISYSLYLWHWPVISYYKYIIGLSISNIGYFTIIALSLLFSSLSYFFVEQKTRHIKKFTDKEIITCAVIGISSFMIIGMLALTTHLEKASWRINTEDQKKQLTQQKLDEAFFDMEKKVDTIEKNYDVIVFGDSHALHYFPIVYKRSRELGLSAKVIANNHCAGFVGNFTKEEKEQCWIVKNTVLKYLPSSKHVFIALKQNSYTDTAENRETFKNNINKTIIYLKALGKKVYILGQVPILDFFPGSCSETTILKRVLPELRDCSKIDQKYVSKEFSYSKSVYKELIEKYDLEYFDPAPYMKKISDEKGIVLYQDRDHINISGARHLYPFVKFKDF